MIEKIRTVTNPLTIIAIFAGLAEVSGSVVLPFLEPDAQAKYIWFLMVFPILLVSMFFLVLWQKHTVLYAPGDYRDEANFNTHVKSLSLNQLKIYRTSQSVPEPNGSDEIGIAEATLQADAVGDHAEPAPSIVAPSGVQPIPPPSPVISVVAPTRDVQRLGFIAEDLALSAFQEEMRRPIQRNVRITSLSFPHVFDGAVVERETLNAIEVKFVPSHRGWRARIPAIASEMEAVYSALPDDLRKGFSATLLLVLENATAETLKEAQSAAFLKLLGLPFPFNVRAYDFADLERQAGIDSPPKI